MSYTSRYVECMYDLLDLHPRVEAGTLTEDAAHDIAMANTERMFKHGHVTQSSRLTKHGWPINEGTHQYNGLWWEITYEHMSLLDKERPVYHRVKCLGRDIETSTDPVYTMQEYLRALYLLCEHWHSGQRSRGYMLLCHCERYYKRWYGDKGWPVQEHHLTEREIVLYEELCAAHCKHL